MARPARAQNWLTEQQIAEYYDVFISFDEDGDKALTVAELTNLMKYIGEHNGDFNGLEILKTIDINDNGLVEFEEFLFLLQLQSCDRNEMVNAAFNVLDPTGEGVITTETLQNACSNLGVTISADEIKDMVSEADPEGKGTVDFQELKTIIKESEESVTGLRLFRTLSECVLTTPRPSRPCSSIHRLRTNVTSKMSVSMDSKAHKRLTSIEEEDELSDNSDSRDPSQQSSSSRQKRRRKKRKLKSKTRRRRRRMKKLYRMLWIFTLNAVVRKIHGNMEMYRAREGNKQSSMFPAIPQRNIITHPSSLKPTRRQHGSPYRSLMSAGSNQKTCVSYASNRTSGDSPRYSMYYLNPVRKHADAESMAWFNAPFRTRSEPSYYHARRKSTL